MGGRYASVSEAVRAGLRLLEKREIKIFALRQALIEGEESGIAEYFLTGLIKELDLEFKNRSDHHGPDSIHRR